MMNENNSPAGPEALGGPGRPRIAIVFEQPCAPRYPRLAHARQVGEIVLRYLGLSLAALWIFGGALFFLVRFSYRFYLANEHAITAVVRKFFG